VGEELEELETETSEVHTSESHQLSHHDAHTDGQRNVTHRTRRTHGCNIRQSQQASATVLREALGFVCVRAQPPTKSKESQVCRSEHDGEPLRSYTPEACARTRSFFHDLLLTRSSPSPAASMVEHIWP